MIQRRKGIIKSLFILFFAAVWFMTAAPSIAHHSFTAEFDINQPITLTGTVTRVEWTNPHAWFYIDVEDDQGNVKSWAIELLGINRLMRSGWTRDKIKPGDVLYVEGFAARNGSPTGNASVVKIKRTGEQIWGSPAGQQDN